MRKHPSQQRGNTLFLILISFVALLLTAAMMAMSKSGVIFAQKSWADSYARRLADSAIYATIGKLKEGEIEFSDDVRFEVEPKIFGSVTFDPGAGVPYSTNNLVGNTKKLGWNNTQVPPKTCHLVGVGDHFGYTVVREAFVKDPPFPYALASAGKIRGEHLEVFGLPEGKYGSLEPGAELTYDDADKEQSEVLSNSPGSAPDPDPDADPAEAKSIVMGQGTKITGHLKAVGEIQLAGDAEVQGMVLPNTTANTLPDIEVGAFDPRGESDAYDWAAENYPSLVGRAWHEGDLTLGNLDMAEGLLYIDGDVTITGNISGKGAIVATGKITVTGSMNTDSDHAALVSGKDLTIRGQGAASSQFQGLIYSKGDIDISKTTIMGAAVSMSDTGVTKLEDTKFIKTPELTALKFETHKKLEEAKDSATKAELGGHPVGIWTPEDGFVELDDAHTEALKALAVEVAGIPAGASTWQVVVETSPGVYDPDEVLQDGDAFKAQGKWEDYLSEVKGNRIEIVEIFDLDLNQLISMDVQLEMLLHRTVSRQPR